MSVYALQVRTGGEKRYIKLFFADNRKEPKPRLHFPQRLLKEYFMGHKRTRTVPVFPGYLFAEIEQAEDIAGYLWNFKKTDGFFRFLPSNKDILPLSGKDLDIAAHFIFQKNDTAGISKVYFDENDRIVITEGPLLGLEGQIVKVDRRKCRAKVKLDLYADSYEIDLAFDVIKNTKTADNIE